MKLLEELCNIHAPAGEEFTLTEFLINYVTKNQTKWKVKPTLHYGKGFQDNIIMVFGKPRTAVFAHLDSIGFTVRYNNEIVKIGGPVKIIKNKDGMFIDFNRTIERGTSLTFKVDFRNTDDFIQSCYMDNRLGVWNCLEVAKTLENGIIVFSSWEEHGGGSAGYLGKFIQEKYGVMQALISDITWVTHGVEHGKGCAISLRDSGIPRKSFINKVIAIAKKTEINFQLEVEDAGGSDGNELQKSNYPWDWCFVGAPEDHVHSPNEKVHKADIQSMVDLYTVLLKEL